MEFSEEINWVIAVFILTDAKANFFSHGTDAFQGNFVCVNFGESFNYFWQQLKAFKRCLSLQLTYFHRVLYLCFMKEIENTAIWLLLNLNYLVLWQQVTSNFSSLEAVLPDITAWSC